MRRGGEEAEVLLRRGTVGVLIKEGMIIQMDGQQFVAPEMEVCGETSERKASTTHSFRIAQRRIPLVSPHT